MASPWRIPLARPDVGEEELAAIGEVLRSGQLTGGPQTAAFEAAFAWRHEVAHAVAFANGTVALAAMYLACGIGPGDEVIVPSLTFISSATSVCHVGARPVFAEVDPELLTLDPQDVVRCITPRTKAVLVVHYGGQPADLAELAEVTASAGLWLLEDAAEAHGAAYRGRPVGGFGRAAMFSFTPTKNITTGEGGMVTTGDGALAEQLRLLRNHGQESLYRHSLLGYNWRITEMQAAMGVVQLGKLDRILERKQQNAARLSAALASVDGLARPATRPDRSHTYMLYTAQVAVGRDRVLQELLDRGIEARVYFPPAHLQPALAGVSPGPGSLPVTEELAGRILSFPVHAGLDDRDIDEVAAAVAEAVAGSPGPMGPRLRGTG